MNALGLATADDVQFLWLPMAHSFGKVLMALHLVSGSICAIDGRIPKIVDNLAVVKPTFMGAAPRIFEKAHGRIMTMQEQEGGPKKLIFDRAFAVGKQVEERKAKGQGIPPHLALQHKVFDKLVFAKIRERFGGRVRFFISGAAALNRDVAEWFHVAGILILEGYGLTETSAGTAVNHPDHYQFGTVGHLFPGTDVRIAEDGEVLLKGPGVMEGYHKRPEATAETVVDGWLHTGDIGELTADGLLRITDRKKDLFKTSGGKYIAPTSIEGQFKAICPQVSQFLVHGAERNYCVALIALDPDGIADWASHRGIDKSYAELVASDEVREMLQGCVDDLNKRLNRWETIKKFAVLDHDLTIESGELTPSMKVKRKVVEDNNRETIEALYA
jgi:long-chain acyl-CoA synthetase